MTDKELNTGEPVAYRSRWKNYKGEVITGWFLHFEKPFNPDARQETELLYHQDYVNQLLGEIEELKAIKNEAAEVVGNIVFGERKPFNKDGWALVPWIAVARGADFLRKAQGNDRA